MNIDKLNQAAAQAEPKAQGFTPKSTPKTSNQENQNTGGTAAEIINEAREMAGQVDGLNFRDAVISGASHSKEWLGVYASTFEAVTTQGIAQYHAARASNKVNKNTHQTVDIKALIKQYTGLDVDANKEQMGKQLETSASQLTLQSTPQLYLLPSVE